MTIEVRRFEESYIVDISGEVGLYNAFRLRDTLRAISDKPVTLIILNLEKVTSIDSSGIGTLISMKAMAAGKQLPFHIVRVPPFILRILELTRLTSLLPIKLTEVDAVEAVFNGSASMNVEPGIPAADPPSAGVQPGGSFILQDLEQPDPGDGAPYPQAEPDRTNRSPFWERVLRAIETSTPLTVRTFKYLPDERRHIDRILAAFLKAADLSPIADDLSYCVHELAANAKKANTKRLYFADRKLNVFDDLDYEVGMQGFKRDVVENIDHYHALLRERGLYVKFQFRMIPKGVAISIRNNATLTTAEKSRIDRKISTAGRFNSLAEAYPQTEDNTEGAGLGIMMMMFMLRNLGVSQDSFDIQTEGNETRASLTIASSSVRGSLASSEAAAREACG